MLLPVAVLPEMVLPLEELRRMPTPLMLAVLLEMVLPLLEKSRRMPELGLPVAVLPEIVLELDVTLIPDCPVDEFMATKSFRVQPLALRVMALPDPPASTTGRPEPLSTPCRVSCLFTLTFS